MQYSMGSPPFGVPSTNHPHNMRCFQSLRVDLLWFVVYAYVVEKTVDIVWPPKARIAGILKGTYPIDVTPPLPLMVWFLIYAIPSIGVGCLFLLYLSGSRRGRQAR